jgi:hypothetical protein
VRLSNVLPLHARVPFARPFLISPVSIECHKHMTDEIIIPCIHLRTFPC